MRNQKGKESKRKGIKKERNQKGKESKRKGIKGLKLWKKMDTKDRKLIETIFRKTILYTLLFLIGYLIGKGKENGIQVGNFGSSISIYEGENWGLGFGEEGSKPSGTASQQELNQYNAHYLQETEDKVLYLTFDCGYENGNTKAILEALKKHNAKATFFVVGHFLESAPDLVKQMVEEGHTVGNHTYHHLDMSKLQSKQKFLEEMNSVAELYQKVTGKEINPYYRPPQGKYSIANLQMAKEAGYHTFFWSLAYVDWNTDAQPSHEEALSKLTKRVHPGAIVLLHNTSKTNGEILDELLQKWEDMGYRFGTLEELIKP